MGFCPCDIPQGPASAGPFAFLEIGMNEKTGFIDGFGDGITKTGGIVAGDVIDGL